jgi:D-glycero-D-manno-heptose 1,7-bisphosphate phosphatase
MRMSTILARGSRPKTLTTIAVDTILMGRAPTLIQQWPQSDLSVRAVFLDRDGTINVAADPGSYVTEIMDFRFAPGALDALAFLGKFFGGKIVVVTNQSPIGWGLVKREQIDRLHAWMIGRIDQAGIYTCPHKPIDMCSCRKPQPGMLYRAARDLDLDLCRSVMVGDCATDIYAAWSAGIPETYLISRPRQVLPVGRPYSMVESLLEATQAIIGGKNESN